jgi:predicted TIM-barrel fold metal-dependent hydrolase
MIIDSHIHIGRWSKIFFNYSSTVEESVDVMRKAGVEEAVCMPADATSNHDLFNEVVNRGDFKFHYCAWIDPDDEQLDNFLEKNLNEISAFKIHPSIQRKRITDESYKKYLRLASDMSIPVIVHCGRWQEIASYRFPLECAEADPGLKIILAHLGGDQPSLMLECASEVKKTRCKNVYMGTESVREFYFVNEVVKTAGAEKIIFGSDYNLGLPQSYIPVIDSLKISREEKEMIFSENIRHLFDQRKK